MPHRGKSWFPNGGALGFGAVPQPVDNSIHPSSPILRGFMWSLVGRPLEDWQTEMCSIVYSFPGMSPQHCIWDIMLGVCCSLVSPMVVLFGIPLQCWMGWSNYFAQNLTKPPWAVGFLFPVLDSFSRQPHDLIQDQLANYPSAVC